MDPIITWEILSRLSEAKGGDDGSGDSLPFFAQRACKEEDNTSLIQEKSLFFKAGSTLRDTTQSPSDKDKPSDTDSSPSIYSLSAITEKIMYVLQQQHRVSIAELCLCLGMTDDDVSKVGELICKPSSSLVCKVYNNNKEIEYGLVESFKKSLHGRINFHCNVSSTSSLEDNKSLHSIVSSLAQLSTVTIKQLSKELELSCEDILRLLKDIELHPNICMSKHNEEITGVYNQEVQDDRMKYIEKEILSCLDEVTTPSSLNSILFGQDDVDEASAQTIVSIANKLCKRGARSGTISIPAASSAKIALATSSYTPQVYSDAQQQLAISFYNTNGYLKFTSFGISRSKIHLIMKQCLPNSVMLGNSLIIDRQKICVLMINDIENAILTQSFANLNSYLPDDIEFDEVREFIDVHLVSVMKEQSDIYKAFNDGLLFIDENTSFFFCSEMVQSCKEMILKLIEEFSISRAKLMTDDQDMIIPLQDVVQCIGDKYTDLLDVQNQHDQNHRIGPLVELCRIVFSEELQRICIQAVKAEMYRINSTLHGVSVSTRTEAASTIQHVEESFESSFRSLCHLLQLFVKSINAIHSRNVSNINVNEMYNELLKGCGSCLAKIITEHYMFKNEVNDNDLSFHTKENKDEQNGSIAALKFPTYSLQCCQNGETRCPFGYLRSLFPGSDGSNISRIWSLCTGKSAEDDNNDENSQDLDASKRLKLFISHLSDNSLALIGLPFSVLDKKTEKKILLARREGLMNRLDLCTDKEEVVMCATALLYQQIKSIFISGKSTITSVLQDLFPNDKKIPEEVTKALQTLRDSEHEDQELIGQVKRFASAKNSKAALLALVNDN